MRAPESHLRGYSLLQICQFGDSDLLESVHQRGVEFEVSDALVAEVRMPHQSHE